MDANLLSHVDFHMLQAFAVAAEECNMRKAAARLHISQPPLSRKIQRLEECLGQKLFTRSPGGLALTEKGAEVLEIIAPLLRQRDHVFQKLANLASASEKSRSIGITTAFEQGIFAGLEEFLLPHLGSGLRLVRKASPKLAADIRNGCLDAAFVALPLETRGLAVAGTGYAEPFMAVLPAAWPEAAMKKLALRILNGKPLFWFQPRLNPVFFEHMRAVFRSAGFAPRMLEEPAEHDVLLARISSGEGMALMPASFAKIRREGCVFVPLREERLFRLELGIASADEALIPVLSIFRALPQ